jgi:predicted MPP superfamily phosphohydrolase
LRWIILFSLLLLTDLYAFQVVNHLPGFTNPTFLQFFCGIYWIIPVATVLMIYLGTNGLLTRWPRSLVVITGSLLFILYLSKICISGMLLLDDLRRLLFITINSVSPDLMLDSGRSDLMVKLAVCTGVIPFLSLTYGMIRNPYRYKVFRQRILIKGLVKQLDGLKVIQISDIHSGSFLSPDRVAKSVELINIEKPDFVFFTGDLVNTKADEMDRYLHIFGGIRSKYGVFSILGNHDYGDYYRWNSPAEKIENFEKLKSHHRTMGWELLLNEHRIVSIGNAAIGIVGVENYSARQRFQKYGQLSRAVLNMQTVDLKILLSHDPSHWEAEVTKSYHDISLTLSGHTHGFQFGIEIPGLIKWSPAKYIYRQWAGLYRAGEQFLYVNRGLGFLGYPGRVGILPEISCLILKTKT